MMRILAARSAIGLAAAALFVSASVQALGLGEVEVRSRLNERFAAAIPVVSASDADLDSLVIEVASPEAFARSGVDRADAVSGLSFVRSGNGIRVSSRDPIRDPFLTFIVEARWNGGRLLREYTVLLDPPDSAPAPTPAPAAATVIAAPTPLPLPSASSSTSASDLPGRYGPVQPSQTLWSIAKLLLRDPGVSQEQMMLALYSANPQAFVGGDIDQLQKGSTLTVPSAAEAKAVDMATARDRVQKLRDAVPNVASTPTPTPATVVAEAPKPAPVAAAVPPPEPAPAPAAAPTDTAVPPAAAAEPAVDAAAAAAPTPDAPVAEVTPEAPAEAVAEAPAPVPAPAPAVVERPTPTPAVEDSTPWPLIGGLLLLLLGLFALKRKGRKEPSTPTPRGKVSVAMADALPPGPDALMERPRPRPPVEDAPPPAAKPLLPASDAELPPISDIDEALAGDVKTLGLGVDASDPMTEADFHLAYGLYDEAAQMLKTAIANDPERGELKVKLAEVWSAAGNAAEFRVLAESMVGKATPAEWQRVSTMGRAILPDMALFRDEPTAAAAAAAAPTAPLADVLRDLSVIDFDLDADVRRIEPVAAPAPAAVEPPPAATADPLREALMEPLEDVALPPLGEPLEADLLKPMLDFTLPPVAAAEPIPVPATTPPPSPTAPLPTDFAELDLSSFDLEDDGAGKAADPGRVEFTMADLEAAADEPLSLEPESTVIGGDEIDTKLDLARAYADMGDAEAAQTLLDEVLAGGNDKQRQDAQALRQRLAG